jgi:molybdate transport system regulatory protein
MQHPQWRAGIRISAEKDARAALRNRRRLLRRWGSTPAQCAAMKSKVQFRLRIYREESIAIGPGKVALLEAVAETGSISAAARHLGMSYRRAWVLIDETNRALAAPAVNTAAGGAHGGGTALTDVGIELVTRYRAIENTARLAAAADIAALNRLLAP